MFNGHIHGGIKLMAREYSVVLAVIVRRVKWRHTTRLCKVKLPGFLCWLCGLTFLVSSTTHSRRRGNTHRHYPLRSGDHDSVDHQGRIDHHNSNSMVVEDRVWCPPGRQALLCTTSQNVPSKKKRHSHNFKTQSLLGVSQYSLRQKASPRPSRLGEFGWHNWGGSPFHSLHQTSKKCSPAGN